MNVISIIKNYSDTEIKKAISENTDACKANVKDYMHTLAEIKSSIPEPGKLLFTYIDEEDDHMDIMIFDKDEITRKFHNIRFYDTISDPFMLEQKALDTILSLASDLPQEKELEMLTLEQIAGIEVDNASIYRFGELTILSSIIINTASKKTINNDDAFLESSMEELKKLIGDGELDESNLFVSYSSCSMRSVDEIDADYIENCRHIADRILTAYNAIGHYINDKKRREMVNAMQKM